MPFNPQHLLNGIAFAHGLNQMEKGQSTGAKKSGATNTSGAQTEDDPTKSPHENALHKLHTRLVEHHLNQMTHHAKQLHVLTGGGK